jgi:hypothetical protein
MSETAKEIFYLLSFSVGTGFLFSKTLLSLINAWKDDTYLEKSRSRRYRP